MRQRIEAAIARIYASNGAIVGAGFLTDERRVLTCAHVVTTALEIPEDAQEMPTGEVLLDFPLVDSEHRLTAIVIHWDAERDIAGLELTDDTLTDAHPVRLVTADDLWGHSFRAIGFPAGYEDGVWTSGVLRGRIGSGWVQIEDVKEPGYWVQPGFSGTPIWDEQHDAVVGMTVAADTDRITKAAFMIPAHVLIEAWPDLAEHSLEAGSLKHFQLQLARLEDAQRRAADPNRFQPQIDALQERIATWGGRVERQRQRIAEGLEEQRQQMAEAQARRREEDRLRVVGQPPLDVAYYFKDRQRDIQKLEQLLSEPTTRMVSVIGHGGMGKTALACKVLQDLESHRWPYTDDELPIDGIVYLSTRTAGISLERLFLDCAKLLGGEERDRLNAVWTNPQLETEEKIARLLETLRDGQYVILLDNLEDLIDDRGQLTDDDLELFFERALMSSQGAQLMVTSRMALAFRREVMRFDCQVNLLEGLPVDDGVALLRELDPNGDYGLRDAPEEQLAEAVELVHGVPRALEVLAGILANDPFAALDEVLETFYEQEDVVQALIEENYQRLDRDARRVIEALAVFKKPVPPLAVDYLLEPFAPGLDVPGIVQRLTRTNIVSVDRAAKTVTLHPIDQDYAYSQLPEEDETESDYTRQALERRAADYYFQLRTPEETWESIEDLEPQLNEFEHHVRGGDYNAACKVLDFIDRDYLYLWGHYKKRLDLRERILGRLSDLKLQISNLEAVGRTYRDLGWTDQAIGFLQKAVAAAKRLGDKQRVGVLLESLSTAYRDLGKISKAIETGQRALDITQETGNRWEESIQLGQLGTAYRLLGQFGQTVELYKDALSTAREVGNRPYEGIWLGSLGIVSCALGQTEFVEELFEDALAIAQETGNRRFEVVWLNNLGNHYLSLGETNYAINIFREALTTAQRMGYQLGKGYQYLKLGEGFLAAREFSKAKNFLIQALNLDMIEINHRASLMLDIVLLRQKEQCAASPFADTIKRCRRVLKDADLYTVIYSLSAALVGQAVCDPHWEDKGHRPELLAPAMEEYRRALEITAAPGVVQDAIRDLELIQGAGIEGLEPVFELLENAEYEPDLPEDMPDILEHIKSA